MHDGTTLELQRVVGERSQLNEKVQQLDAFIWGHLFNSLPSEEKARLIQQLGFMKAYRQILDDRIVVWMKTLSQSIEASIGKFTPNSGDLKMVTVIIPAGIIDGAPVNAQSVTMKLMDAYNVRAQLLNAIDVLGTKTDMGHPPAPGKKK